MGQEKKIVLHPPAKPVDATVRVPGSKSLTNRALVLAALADGRSQLDGILLADDTRLMLEALKALGLSPRLDAQLRRVALEGHGGRWPSAEGDIFCGNAGTVMRFLTAACCVGLGDYRLDGVPRMRSRPIGELVDALRDLGASISYEAEEGFCPLNIQARG
jgi:3-phosphoshikimate 1-carboxyvinyltransferase